MAAPEFLPVARLLQTSLRGATGWVFPIEERDLTEDEIQDPFLHATICIGANAQLSNPEAYQLQVGWTAIRIQASRPAGAFYAVQSLLQLLPPAVHQAVPRLDVDWSLPCVIIEDEPRFSWRGGLLDSSRHFQPVSFIKKFIDLLALHKLNVFHWHFIDDQGWRIEIKKYPRLTEIGARRRESCLGHLTYRAGGDGQPHEGFYTQEEIREVVSYAAERFINIVPEVEMPGHAQAAVAAYPELGCLEKHVEVSTTWGVHKTLLHPGATTLTFLQNVLTEVMELFPGTFIHVGGDEAEKEQWNDSPTVQQLITELNLKDAEALQSHFIKQVAEFLAGHGRRLVCWDEVLAGGAPDGAVIMAWRGPEHGVAAANAGHEVVMTPKQSTYFDYYQSLDTSAEPLAIGGYTPLEKVYNFEPVPSTIVPQSEHQVRGVQAQLWTEYMPNTGHIEYMAFPRLCALSEVAWSLPANRDWEDFRARLTSLLKRLEILGVRYRNPE